MAQFIQFMISNTTRSLLSLYLLFGDMKKLPSSFLFSSRTRVTVRYVKPAASRVFLHTCNFGGVNFCFLLCHSKQSCTLQIILFEVLLTRFPFGIVNSIYRCRSIITATVSLTFLPRHAGMHQLSTRSCERPQTRNNFTFQ